MDTAHRKIELQSPADLNYLRANATRAAHAKLDLHFPPSAAPESGDDAMKMRVQELVDQVCRNCYTLPTGSQDVGTRGRKNARTQEREDARTQATNPPPSVHRINLRGRPTKPQHKRSRGHGPDRRTRTLGLHKRRTRTLRHEARCTPQIGSSTD